MKKRLLIFMLTLVFLTAALSTSAFAATSGKCGETARWSVSGDVLTISGSGEMYDYHFMSPRRWPKTITEIVIEDGITHIGDYAFIGCEDLRDVTIPDSVTSIGGTAFDGCKALQSIALPDSVTTIGSYAFSECEALESMELPASLTSIGQHAFSSCEALESMELPEGLTVIDSYAFLGCDALRSVTIPDSVTDMGDHAFSYCKALESITLPSSLTVISDQMFSFCESLKSVSIPDSVVEIKDSAFRDCTALRSITLPDSVTTIGPTAFWNCTALETITIPASVTMIGNYAFVDCSALDTVYYDGTREQWDAIDIKAGNEVLTEADIVCQVISTPTPTVKPTPTPTPTVKPTPTPTVKPTPTPTMKPTPTPTTKPTPTPTPEPIENPFTDVRESDWYFAPVLWAVENKVTGGVGEGMFGPDNGCTRGQVVTFLWAAAGKPEPKSEENPFTDVSPADYFYKPVLWAVENNITGGVGEGLFGPYNTCTRGQIVTFLWAAKGKPVPADGGSPFQDVAAADYFYKPVLWAVENQITGGIGEGLFGPHNTCTRGQVVTFLYKAYDQ